MEEPSARIRTRTHTRAHAHAMPEPTAPTTTIAVALATAIAAVVALGSGLVVYAEFRSAPDVMRGGGTVAADVQSDFHAVYGFGAGRRLLVVNVSKIGGVEQIDANEKRHATMRVFGDSLRVGEDAEDGSTLYDVGFEFKGMSASGLVPGTSRRIQGSYSFEIWEPDGEGGWQDAKEQLFFENAMEDFVLRSGALDPSLVRDFASPDMAGAAYERTLVELIFIQPGDVNTYEGVFLLAQNIKRRMLDKNGHIASNGKRGKCADLDDGSAASAQQLVDETVLLFEIDRWRRHTPPPSVPCPDPVSARTHPHPHSQTATSTSTRAASRRPSGSAQTLRTTPVCSNSRSTSGQTTRSARRSTTPRTWCAADWTWPTWPRFADCTTC